MGHKKQKQLNKAAKKTDHNLTAKKRQTKQSFSKNSIYIACVVIALFSLTLFNLSLVINRQRQNITTRTTSTNSNLLIFWKHFLKINPSYLPGWVELSKLELENGQTINAFEAFTKASSLNPNSNEVKVLGERIGI